MRPISVNKVELLFNEITLYRSSAVLYRYQLKYNINIKLVLRNPQTKHN